MFFVKVHGCELTLDLRAKFEAAFKSKNVIIIVVGYSDEFKD
jgi:hypothetical protein